MKKSKIIISAATVFCGLLSIPFINQSNQVPEVQAAESLAPKMQTVEYEMLRYKEYDDLKELKKDAQHVILASFVEKQAPIPDGGGGTLYRTENVFHVEKVLKGDKSIAKTNILVNEQGGIVGNKKYVGEGNELFDSGQYMLFLEKITDRSVVPYDIYVVQGVTSGKIKLNGDQVKGFGKDKVRQAVETVSKQDLISAVESLQ